MTLGRGPPPAPTIGLVTVTGVVATDEEHPLDVSTVAALDHVRGRLADEFGSRITAADITRYVAQAHKDLGHPSPAALP